MKTSARLTPYLMGLIVALLVWGAPLARAQQTMEIPPPSSQTQPPIHYRPKPTPRPKPRATPPPVEQYQQE